MIKEPSEQIEEPEVAGRRFVKRSASNKSTTSGKNRSSSRDKPRFSFRDVDPYSKTKSINIQKVKSHSAINYEWEQKENDDRSNNLQRQRSLYNEIVMKNSPSRSRKLSSNHDY